MKRYRVGVDIGGTFTDAVLMDTDSGRIAISKVLTTPSDPAVGFMDAINRLREEEGVTPEEIADVVHATTIATNAILERRGSRVGLVVTRGFRDILEIGRQVRHELYNLQTEKPVPLVPRELVCEVTERVDYRGHLLEPLDVQDIEAAAELFRQAEVECVAVCFLHAYMSAEHERRAGDLLRALLPETIVCLSSDVAPEMREYWRASTCVVNAYVAPVVSRYLSRVESKLKDAGLVGDVRIMQSNGGLVSLDAARERPVGLIESGPAAGVTGASFIASLLGIRDAISFDMGGTTAKMGLVFGGEVNVRAEFEVAAGSLSGSTVAKGSGYPILGSVMDLVEVGAGGGSIAWVDSGGALRVGPTSAGADPGPACYGKGGKRPTVTDANLLLGRLDPRFFLGGLLQLDVEAARLAIQTACADELELDIVEAAMGIVDIANAAMVQAMRLVTVERGHDPRDFALIAFGGAGALHAASLADALNVSRVVVPLHPGVSSAFGLVVSDCRIDLRRALLQPVDAASPDQIASIFEELEEQARAVLVTDSSLSRIDFMRQLDMRYVGQSWKLPVAVAFNGDEAGFLSKARAGFDSLHEQSYGFAVPDEDVEIVNIAVTATGRIEKPTLARTGALTKAAPSAKGERMVYFREAGGFMNARVFDRHLLTPDVAIDGPLLLEAFDSTILVPPEWWATSTDHGLVVLER